VTVFFACSAEISWNICEGVSGVPFYAKSDTFMTGCDYTHLIVANEPQSWRLVVLVVRYQDIVSSHLKKIAFRDLHLTMK
jgi:hypothetical protein